MKALLLASLFAAVVIQTLSAQQFTPPALPPGAKSSTEMFDADIVKIYSLDDQGASFRAYVVKYKGSEVIVGDTLAQNKKVGDKIKVIVARVELPGPGNLPVPGNKVHNMSFQIMPSFAKK